MSEIPGPTMFMRNSASAAFLPKWSIPVPIKKKSAVFYGLELTPLEAVHDADCIVFLVQHEVFRKLQIDEAASLFRRPKPGQKQVLIDVKGMFERKAFEEKGFLYWSL